MTAPTRVVFEFTYVEYPSDEPLIGIFMVIISYIPLLIPVVVLTIAVSKNCPHHALFFIGLVMSHGLAKLIKKISKQPRPAGAFLSNYGMPSDHSMLMFFVTTYVGLLLMNDNRVTNSSTRISISSFLLTSLLVAYSRLYLGVHSVAQVSVGSILGIAFGCCWYLLSKKFFFKSRIFLWLFQTLHGIATNIFYKKKANID
jgi:dolichyldiphosphatase